MKYLKKIELYWNLKMSLWGWPSRGDMSRINAVWMACWNRINSLQLKEYLSSDLVFLTARHSLMNYSRFSVCHPRTTHTHTHIDAHTSSVSLISLSAALSSWLKSFWCNNVNTSCLLTEIERVIIRRWSTLAAGDKGLWINTQYEWAGGPAQIFFCVFLIDLIWKLRRGQTLK